MSRIFIGFLGNIHYDTRTTNWVVSLKTKGHQVFFQGYDWETPGFLTFNRPGIRVQKLAKIRFSLIYYLRFAADLLFRTLRERFDLYLASDFYSLPFCAAAARFWGAELVYDSREIYSELPSFHDRPLLKKTVVLIEKACLARARCVTATGQLDSEVLEKLLGIRPIRLLRNFPLRRTDSEKISYSHRFRAKVTGKILVYQGILVPGRGIETLFQLLKMLPTVGLVLLGGGVYGSFYRDLAEKSGVGERVLFAGKIRQRELSKYTAGSDIGMSLIENTCDNNYYALPNKLFEYIMAGLPVVVSDMPQMRAVVEQFGVGAVVPGNDAEGAAKIIKGWEKNPAAYLRMRRNCAHAAGIFNWETEFEQVYRQIFPL
jgi:glycosyltransferase involved in cell wall biosynthesis